LNLQGFKYNQKIEKQFECHWAESACCLARSLLAQCWHDPSCIAHATHGLARPASRRGPRARGRRWKAAHATTSARARARATLVMRRWLRTGTNGALQHTGVTLTRGRRGGDAAQGEGSSPATSRRRRRGWGRQPASVALEHAWLAVTCAGRRRRGGAAGNQSTRRQKRGERGDWFSRRMTTWHTYPGRRRGRRRRGTLGHARSEAEWRRLWTRAVGRRALDMETVFRTAALSAGAFMAWVRARARGATWRRRADERARHGEREADRWDPVTDNSQIKNNFERK
jgi:hypothetical protein